MAILGNIDINTFTNIYEIELSQEPNQSFDMYLGDDSFKFDIRTYAGNQTRINIKANDEVIVNYAPVNTAMVNLNYFSNFKKGAFFFWQNANKIIENPNFENFGNGLKLYYGSF